MIATICMIISSMAVFCLPAAAEAPNYTSIQDAGAGTEASLDDYQINSTDDWMYLYNNLEVFRKPNITIHLGADIDLSQDVAKDFKGFTDPAFSLDGHGHTIKNWGSEEAPISTRAMFYVSDNVVVGTTTDGGMNFIKNVKFENCHTKAGATSAALVYAVGCTNAGYIGLPTNFTMDHISFDGCSVLTSGGWEAIGMLLSRYAVTGASAVAAISNITVKNSKLTAGKDHAGFLVGKIHGSMTYNISNCLLEGNTLYPVKTGKEFSNGLVVGTVEAGTANLRNIALIGNTIDVAKAPNKAAALIGRAESSTTLEGIAALGNKVIETVKVSGSNEPQINEITNGVYLLGDGTKTTGEKLYCDAPLKVVAKGNANLSLDASGEDVAGEAAWALSKTASGNTDFYWTIDSANNLIKAESKEKSMRRADFKSRSNGTIFQTQYREGGTDVQLFVDGDDGAKFYLNGNELTGPVYTIPSDAGDLLFEVEVNDLVVARSELRIALRRYNGKDLKYYKEGLAEKIAEAEAAVKDDSGATLAELQLLTKELNEWGYVEATDLPSVTKADEFPDFPGYVIMNVEDLLYAKRNESNFAAEQTLYLGADLDMTGVDFSGFGKEAAFKFDGLNHTIKNWTKELPQGDKDRKIGFFNASATSSIKNVTFDTIKLGAFSDSAIVYGSHKDDAVPNDRLVIENVHVKNSLLKAYGLRCSVFVANTQTARIDGFTVRGCSIVDTKIEAQNNDKSFTENPGDAIGGFIGNVQGVSSAIEVENCYAGNFDITGAGDMVSIFCGKMEKQGDGCSISVANSVAIDCDIEALGDISLIASRTDGGALYTKNVVIANCNLNSAGKGTNKYNFDNFEGEGKGTGEYVLWGNVDWYNGSYLQNLYLIPEEWPDACWANTNPPAAGRTVDYTGITNEDIASGKLAYRLNHDSGMAYWAMEKGKIVLADESNKPVVQVEVQAEDGMVLSTYYVNGNDPLILDITGAKSYEIAAGSTGTIEGNILKLSGDGADVVVKAALNEEGMKVVYAAQIRKLLDFFRSFEQYGAEFPALVASLLANNNMTADQDAEVLQKTLADLEEIANTKEFSPVTTEVSNYPDGKAYSVWTKEHWLYLSANHDKFNRNGVVIYFGADIDMTGATGFTTLQNSKIALNGQNHKIYNWTHTFGSYGTAAIFSGTYQGGSVKNLTFEDCSFEGGYSRAVLFAEYTGGNVVVENVDMINVTLDTNCNANHNQMGLYVSRTNADVDAEITIKNCLVKDSKLENSCGATINNCGILIGCIKNKYNFTVENVDLINCENNTDTGAGGLVLGSIETPGRTTLKNVGVFGGKITVADTSPYAGVVIGITANANKISFQNCFVRDVKASFASATGTPIYAWYRSSDDIGNKQITVTGCYADFDAAVAKVNNATGALSQTYSNLSGVAPIDTVETIKYELGYRLDRHVSDEAGKYLPLRAMEGYGKVYKIDFYDQFTGEKEFINSFYTKASGKLPASAESTLNGAEYDWALDGMTVDADTVFTADAEVISAAVHDFEGAEKTHIDGTNTHKVTCKDCHVEFILNCTGATYSPTATRLQHIPTCECGNTLEAETCVFEYTHVAGTDTHTGKCELCGRDRDARSCSFKKEGYYQNESDKPTTEKEGLMTFDCSNGCGNKKTEKTPKLAFAKAEVEGDSMVTFGETFEIKIALKENQAPGLSGMEAILHYDAAAMTIDDPENDVELHGFLGSWENEAGALKIMIGSGIPVTEDVVVATVKFTATTNTARAGDYGVELEVKQATVSGVDVNDPTTLPLGMRTEGLTVHLAESEWGDVNRDGNVALSDVILILRANAGVLPLADLDKQAANVTGDAVINTADAALLLRYVMQNQ